MKMVILNNRSHGMVRQFQESYFDGRYQSTCWGYSAPEFVAVAAAYEIGAGREGGGGAESMRRSPRCGRPTAPICSRWRSI